ncbi:hypothetical protein [Streptomyces sp. NPDC053560]|uniref:hypothetical protein n=1 Tax=Streptomyces sp. NPDC053560 TaxID=3365711 RepID=UPI0037D67C0C
MATGGVAVARCTGRCMGSVGAGRASGTALPAPCGAAGAWDACADGTPGCPAGPGDAGEAGCAGAALGEAAGPTAADG